MGLTKELRNLPYEEFKRALHFTRRYWFSVGLPNVPGMVLDIDAKRLERILKEEYQYEDADRYSYHYDEEVVNVRTPHGLSDEGKQMENHIRLFDLEGDDWPTFCMPHYEHSRFEHWEEHINDVGLSWDRGIEIVTNVSTELGVDYKYMTTSAAYNNHHDGELPEGVEPLE